MAEQIEDIHRHIVPYVFQEFPKYLHKAGGASLLVQSSDEQAAAVKKGWKLKPVLEADVDDKAAE